MLGDPRTVRVGGDGTAGLHRRTDDHDAEARPDDYRGTAVPEAYCWSNLTSGNSSRAMWLLLLPFMVVNLAHWMRPPSGRRRERLDRSYDLLVRLAALSLTVLLVAAACEVSIDLVAWQCAGTPGCADHKAWLGFLAADRGGWWSPPGRRMALASVVPIAITLLLWWLSHRTWSAYESQKPVLPGAVGERRPDGRSSDDRRSGGGRSDGSARGGPATSGPAPDRPAPGGPAPDGPRCGPGVPALALPGFWYGRRLVARLRASHTAAGFLTVAAALLLPAIRRDHASGHGLLVGLGWALAAVLILLSGAVLLVLDRSGRSEESADEVVDRYAVRALPGFALGGAVLAALYAGWDRGRWRSGGWAPGADVFTGIAVVQGVLVVLLAFVAWWMHDSRTCGRTVLHGLGGPAVAMIACALGALMSAGTAQRVADWLDRGATPGQEHGLITGPPVILIWQASVIPPVLAVLLVLLAVVAVQYWRARAREIDRVRRSHPGEPEQPARTRQIARADVRAGLTDKAPALVATGALATFALGAVAVFGSMATHEIPGDAARGTAVIVAGLAQTSQALGSWLIGAAVLLLVTLGRRAYRDAGARRTVGILWDVGTFWPRAAHPFAPPCYAERAVPDLTWRMVTWTREHGRRLVLSGHSQGTVLAAAAAWQLDTRTRDRVALLTYGSPLERLYGRYFPAYLGPTELDELSGELHAWKNLWRRTDPIGGPVKVAPSGSGPPVDTGPLPDPASYGRTEEFPLPCPILGHHDYRDDPAFAVARSALLEQLMLEGADRGASSTTDPAPPDGTGPGVPTQKAERT
ncbi:hypothetical protein GCM10012280_55230 [Wenjunlia tyrosinilytica]|uniref:Integral membrane protein n=2 Tax=Wenjunlia tyrosinilytica TaxID=1544741 RepID=A0A918E106_9ACTN|nr:hypothetical protein GCM10012280_55230 [Wenjunlia tyrosinilytica]